LLCDAIRCTALFSGVPPSLVSALSRPYFSKSSRWWTLVVPGSVALLRAASLFSSVTRLLSPRQPTHAFSCAQNVPAAKGTGVHVTLLGPHSFPQALEPPYSSLRIPHLSFRLSSTPCPVGLVPLSVKPWALFLSPRQQRPFGHSRISSPPSAADPDRYSISPESHSFSFCRVLLVKVSVKTDKTNFVNPCVSFPFFPLFFSSARFSGAV